MKGPALKQEKNREDERTMISKTLRVALTIVLASFALSSDAWAATCSNASLSVTYGLLKGGTDRAGQPTTGVSQLTFDSTTGTYYRSGHSIPRRRDYHRASHRNIRSRLELHRHG
jgi:hypothetical protein